MSLPPDKNPKNKGDQGGEVQGFGAAPEEDEDTELDLGEPSENEGEEPEEPIVPFGAAAAPAAATAGPPVPSATPGPPAPAAPGSPLSPEEERAALELEQEERELKSALEELTLLELEEEEKLKKEKLLLEEQNLREELRVIEAQEAQLEAQEDEPKTKVRQEDLSAEEKERLERDARESAMVSAMPEDFTLPLPPLPSGSAPAPKTAATPKLSVETPSPTPKPVVGIEGPASDLTFSGKQGPRPISAKGRRGKPEGPEVGKKGKDDKPEDRREPKIGEEMNWRTWAQGLFAGFRMAMKNIVGPFAKPILGALQVVNGAVTFGIGKLSRNENLQKNGLEDMRQGGQAIASGAEGGWEAIKTGAKGIRDIAYAVPVVGPLLQSVVRSRDPKPEPPKPVPDAPPLPPEFPSGSPESKTTEETKRLREVNGAAFDLSRSGTELVPNPHSEGRPDEITPKRDHDAAASEPLASAAKAPAVSPEPDPAPTPDVDPDPKIGHDRPRPGGGGRR